MTRFVKTVFQQSLNIPLVSQYLVFGQDITGNDLRNGCSIDPSDLIMYQSYNTL